MSHAEKAEIKADVEQTLPLNSSGIVAMFEPQWTDAIDKALSGASNVTKEQVDGNSADEARPRPRRIRRLRPRSAVSSPTVLDLTSLELGPTGR
ncbi:MULTISPECIES: hypothetical protein [Kribbella]|uniref:hypothetical protein n=1 Tax=Kribbella TaxID=182639 RepID=UPI00104AA6F3|nr:MULTISPECIES: hypothetical protein [Kribbella]